MIIDFDLFKKVTSYDIKSFFKRFADFINNDYPKIVSYYVGNSLDQDSFFELNYLLKQSSIIEPLFIINTNRLSTIDMWELLDLFSEIQTKLWTIEKTGKWMKSSRLNTNSVSTKINRIQNQYETLEMMSSDLGYADSQNDWTKLAINNQVTEESYTMEGGKMFTVSLQNNFNIGLDNIIDFTTGKNILGKDIVRKISFVNNDLETVEFEKAMDQSFEIKINAQKNSIPEFPEYGVNNEMVGTNVASISYPTLFRDLLNLFKQDARWREVNLLDLYRKDDAVYMKFEAKSILKDVFVTNINV